VPTKRLTDGNDTYTTDGKFDVVLALKGNDKITIKQVFYDAENDVTRITVYGGPGDDQIISEIDISGQVAYGGPGNDKIVMRGGDDLGGAAHGGGGSDTITCIVYQEPCFADGGAGQDTLISQSETATTLEGGLGKDTSIGGPLSNDTFRFEKGHTVSGSGRDVIRSFVKGQDEIDLSSIDANTNQSGNQAFKLVASTNNPAIGEVSYFKSGTSTIVVADTGATTFQIELKNFDQPLEATDFSL
jgi:hypothetical protein